MFIVKYKNGFYLYSSKNLEVPLKIQSIFVILLSFLILKNFRGTCSSIEMLKGYMVRERLGTPVLEFKTTNSEVASSNNFVRI